MSEQGMIENTSQNVEPETVVDEAGALRLAEHLISQKIWVAALDLDGTLYDPQTKITVPRDALEALIKSGAHLFLVSGSAPITMRDKLLADGVGGGQAFSAIAAADGALTLDPVTLMQEQVEILKTVKKQTPIPKEEVQILADQLPAWLQEHQELVRFAAFHPSVEAVEEGEIFGYWLYAEDEGERRQLAHKYEGMATVVDSLNVWTEMMRRGAVKVTIQCKDAEALGEIKKQNLPGQLNRVVWEEGGDDRLVAVAGEVNKYSVLDEFGGTVIGEEFWRQTVCFGNDANDYPAMRRAAMAVVVNSRPEAAQALIQRLLNSGYRGKIWVVEPMMVEKVFSSWGEKRHEAVTDEVPVQDTDGDPDQVQG